MSIYEGWDPPRPGWVCGECHFDYDGTDVASVAAAIRQAGDRYSRPLSRGLPDEDLDAVLRAKPSPTTWSALEYACHVRDALALYDWRIEKALTEDRPAVPSMRRDDIAVEHSYNDQDPSTVATELATAAGHLADRLETIDDDGWNRSAVREGEELTVGWMARNVLHECNHHLLDIGRVLREARGR